MCGGVRRPNPHDRVPRPSPVVDRSGRLRSSPRCRTPAIERREPCSAEVRLARSNIE
jgi:hypothetical protein